MQKIGRVGIHSPESCVILEDLLIGYGETLKTLEVQGVWNIDLKNKFYPLYALETLNISDSLSPTLRSMIIISGQYITTLELYDILGDDASGEECYLPNLKHLHIDADTLGYFELVRKNAKHIESLVILLDDPGLDLYFDNLPEFENLKLLEVNCPLLNNSILKHCTQTLEYLYVPSEDATQQQWNEINLDLPIGLPSLKDLCVNASKRWSVNMIRKNCESLECLILYGYMNLEEFLGEGMDDDDEDAYSIDGDDDEETGEYCWPNLVAMDCRFPRLKMLLLPGCTDSNIVESLTAKCPDGVQVISDKEIVGEIVRTRIKKKYGYTRYIRMMNPSLSGIFKSLKQRNVQMDPDEFGGYPSIMDVVMNEMHNENALVNLMHGQDLDEQHALGNQMQQG
jgi:hypothetical protein